MATDLAKLKELIYKNIDLVFSNLGIKVDEQNGSWFSTCPIHDGSDNPNGFSYSPNKHMWKCWTRGCHEEYNSDIFGLIRGVLSKKSGKEVSFGEVLGWVQRILNIEGGEIDQVELSKETPDSFISIVKKFKQTYEEVEDKPGTDWPSDIPSKYFMEQRGFEAKTLKEFGVGDCEDRSSKMKFRSVIPVYSEGGDTKVASICRSNLDYIEPKFLIEKGFDKRFYLYNHHRAKKAAMEKSTLFIVEGQSDVWRLWEAGVTNVVGIFGKEVSPEQERKISAMGITKLVVLLDHDQAGREAKVKIQRIFGRFFKLLFPKLRTRKDVGQMSPEHIKEKILPNLRGLY